MKTGFFILVFTVSFLAAADENETTPIQCDMVKTRSEGLLCMDTEASDLDAVNNRVYKNLMAELESRYKTKDPKRLAILKAKINNSVYAWIAYRDSACEIETIHIENEDEKNQYYKDCLLAMLRNRIEELRVLQITLKNITFKMPTTN